MASLGMQRLLQSVSRTTPRFTGRFVGSGSRSTVDNARLFALAKYSTTPSASPSTASKTTTTAASAQTPPPPSPLPDVLGSDGTTDWSRSYSGLSAQPFPKEITDILLAPIDPMDVEMKPGASRIYQFNLILILTWF